MAHMNTFLLLCHLGSAVSHLPVTNKRKEEGLNVPKVLSIILRLRRHCGFFACMHTVTVLFTLQQAAHSLAC